MSKTSSVKTDFVLPIAVLTLICLVCAALLGYFNSLTGPIIAETVAAEEARARQEVLPEADSFTELDLDLPDTFEDGTKNYVTRVYAADNGAGYVFMVTGNGYGGKGTMKLVVSLSPEGAVLKTVTQSHSETAGMGSKTADESYRSQWEGVTAETIDTVDAVSGATISSTHYLNSMRSVFEDFAWITR